MRVLVLMTAAIVALACAAAPVPTVTTGPTPTATASPSPSPSPYPTASPSPTPTVLTLPTASPIPSPAASPTLPPAPSATPTGELSIAQVRYLLMDQLGPLHYCDPDEYPISRGDEQQKADEQFPIIQADTETFDAIAGRIGLAGHTSSTEADKLNVYREWKTLNAVDAQPLGNGVYQFDVTTEGDASSGQALHMQGTVDALTGQISIVTQEQVFGTSCPICLARGTLIGTPVGPVAVDQLKVGDPIWTQDRAGNRIASTVARVGSVPVPSTHRVVDLFLADGREVRVSPGHPLADGRHAADLRPGDWLDGATVVRAGLIAYDGGRTFDVLPATDTGFYWANGVLLASTLR